MSGVLSPDWCASVSSALADVEPGPGGSGVVEVVVTGGEPARQSAVLVIDAGRLTAISVDGSGPESEVAIPQSRADFEAMVRGELDPAIAFMRGDLKPDGSSRAVFALLSALARPQTQHVLRSHSD